MRRIRRASGLRWLSAAMMPWASGMGLLVSFTATAGTDLSRGAASVTAPDVRIASPLSNGEARAVTRVSPASRRGGEGGASLQSPPFSEPAQALGDAGGFAMNASFTGSVTGLLTPGIATWTPDLESDSGFVPTPELGLGGASGRAEPAEAEDADGATPAIPRAVALSSTTPAPADATPIEGAAANLMIPGLSARRDATDGATTTAPEIAPDSARHRYADLIGPDAKDREQRCLAEAVYFEARSEPEDGQAAVAQVVLNRVKSGLYPNNVCGVVYQNRHRYMGCQFSFACEGKSLRIADGPSWQSATRIASAVIDGRTYLSEVGGATHYHADYVRPGWSRRLQKMDVIGRHIFYQLKRGQT